MTSPIDQLVSDEELSGPSYVSVRLKAFELFTALQAAEVVCAWACAPIAAVRPPPIPRQRNRRATTRHRRRWPDFNISARPLTADPRQQNIAAARRTPSIIRLRQALPWSLSGIQRLPANPG